MEKKAAAAFEVNSDLAIGFLSSLFWSAADLPWPLIYILELCVHRAFHVGSSYIHPMMGEVF